MAVTFREFMLRNNRASLYSDYRNVGPSDSEKEYSSRRDSEATGTTNNLPASRLAVGGNDSESGGSHSPSPRASRRRQVRIL